MKGIVLAGGTGSRLLPLTLKISKQLLPVYDKPMVYYPISTLMLAGIREILIITTPQDLNIYESLLGNGDKLGVKFDYAIQSEPKGIAQAFTIAESFLSGDSCLLILGDNVFHGAGLGREITRNLPLSGAHIFTYEVRNPSEYGVLGVDSQNKPISITEKPTNFISNLAVTGLYFFDNCVVSIAKHSNMSMRGEFEIATVIEDYLKRNSLTVTNLSRGVAWLDMGTHQSLHEAAAYIRTFQERQGLLIGSPEEVAWRSGWISDLQLQNLGHELDATDYGKALLNLVKQK